MLRLLELLLTLEEERELLELGAEYCWRCVALERLLLTELLVDGATRVVDWRVVVPDVTPLWRVVLLRVPVVADERLPDVVPRVLSLYLVALLLERVELVVPLTRPEFEEERVVPEELRSEVVRPLL